MENTAVEEKKTIPEKIVAAPVVAVAAVEVGLETVGHDLAQGAVEAATLVVEDTKTVVREFIPSGEKPAKDVRPAASPRMEPLHPPVETTAPVA